MRIGSFSVATPVGLATRVGVLADGAIIDATAARIAQREGAQPASVAHRIGGAEVPPDLRLLLEGGAQALRLVAESVEYVRARGLDETSSRIAIRHEPHEVILLPPVPRPPGIACFSVWPQHIADTAEHGFALRFPPEGSRMRPYYKGNPDAVVGPDAVLERPAYAGELDVECEMAAVVGSMVKDADEEEAAGAIAGYCLFNDVSVRDVQVEEMRLGLGPTKGKDLDGGNVLGPWIVTPDEVGDTSGLHMSLLVNGEQWSDYPTSEMAWKFPDLLSYLSRGQTVHSGHVLTSGSYPGGSAMDLGRALSPGDVVELRISKLGSLVNTIA